MNLKSILCSSLMLTSGLVASSAVEFVDGAVYRFTNNNTPFIITAPESAGSNITIQDLDESDPHQLWLAELNSDGSGYYLRELKRGAYMTSPIQTSTAWTTTNTLHPDDSKMSFIVNDVDDGLAVFYPIGFIPGTTNAQAGYAHANGNAGTNLLCWEWNKPASKWHMTLVDITDEEIAEYKKEWPLTILPNKVYWFENNVHHHAFYATNGQGNVNCKDRDESDPTQLWVTELTADGNSYYLRNYVTGNYLSSPLATGSYWTCSKFPIDAKSKLIIDRKTNNSELYVIYPDGIEADSRNYAHEDDNYRLYSWGQAHNNSKWIVHLEESISEADLQAAKAGWTNSSPNLTVLPDRVYHIKNELYGNAMTHNIEGKILCADSDPDNESQLWVTEEAPDGNGYFLRNYKTGAVVTCPMQTSAQWTIDYTAEPDTNTSAMTFRLRPDGFVFAPTSVIDQDTHRFAHEAAGGNVVCWTVNNALATHWTLTPKNDISEADLAKAKENWSYSPPVIVAPNRVYTIVNAQYGNALTTGSNDMPVTAAPDPADKSQLWISEEAADGSGIILRNYENGAALLSSMQTSVAWTLAYTSNPDPEKSVMAFRIDDNGVMFAPASIAATNTFSYAHEIGNGQIVSWTTNNARASHWLFNLDETISETDIATRRQSWAFVQHENMENALTELFADKACSELNPQYAAMTEEQMQQNEYYLALPDPLRQMVIKILTDDWSETDPNHPEIQWDSEHAKKFRLQLYEPYSQCDAVAGLTKIQAYTNLNNPTGIVANEGNTLYVMVEKGAAEGSTLYIAPRTFADNVNVLNRFTDGIELHEGLNIIDCNDNGSQMTIYYSVQTNEGRQRLHKLTDFDDIKIHIEGGSINGFFNPTGDELYTPDTNEDWFYYRERAQHERFCLLTDYVLLYMHFQNVVDDGGTEQKGLKNLLTREEYEAGNFDLNATMAAWDQMFVAEMLVMGLMSDAIIRAEQTAGRDWYDTLEGDEVAPSDYSLYFNNRLMGISETSGFMSATWYRTKYHVNTLRSIIMQFPTMDLWGPAHEFGHMNQGPMLIAGTTEESNNVFSNVALFYRGDKTSRSDLPSVQFDNFNKGYNFHQHGTWGTTRMWFQLWLYYHATGHNKKFYPRLYELLRENPLKKNSTTHLNAKDDLLHFAKMCCIAAGEDLTDFFDAWGFLVPQDGYYIGDYTSYTSYLSEEEIEDWRAEIAQMAEENGWKKNTSIIFIDDRVGSTKPAYADWCRPENAGSMGGLQDFTGGNDRVSGDYEFTVNGTSVSVTGGSGGVGFLIYDANGRLIGFSNEPNFEVSPEAAKAITSGEVSFSVIENDSEEVKVADAVRESDLETRMAILNDILTNAEDLFAKTDFENRKVGYLKAELVSPLKEIYDDVKAKIDNNEINEDNFTEIYVALNNEVATVSGLALNEENTITIKDGAIYVFASNNLYTGRGIRPSANGRTATLVPEADVDHQNVSQQWIFTAATEGETPGFYIKNMASGKYLNFADSDATSLPLSDTPEKFIPEIQQPGFIALCADVTIGHKAIHAASDGNIVRWGSGAEASQWALMLIDDSAVKVKEFELRHLILRAEELLAQSGGISVEAIDPQPVVINGENLYTNAECKNTQYGDQFTDRTWGYLFDDDSSTIFHSDYSGQNSSDGLNHYIRIELPTDVDFDCFVLGYRTRGPEDRETTNAPAQVQLAASADNEEWTEVLNVTSGLSGTGATDVTLPGCLLPPNTRYVRFMVNNTSTPNAQAGGHRYFTISELRLYNAQSIVGAIPAEQYSLVEPEMMLELFDEIRQSQTLLEAEHSTDDIATATEMLNEKYQTLLAAMNRNSERLAELISETRLIAAEIGTNSENITPVDLTVDHYSSNAVYTGTNQGDHLSSWEVLFDNDPDTYFHSKYDGATDDDLDHYIRIELPEPTTAEETHFILTYRTRNQNDFLYTPAEAVIEYSADAENWTLAQELDAVLPTTRSTLFESETFEVPAGTSYIRFTVNKSRRSATNQTSVTSAGHAYFCVSEFGLSTHEVTSVPNSENYPDSNEPAIVAALRQTRNSEIVLNAANTSHPHYDQAYNALLPHYQTLLAIKNNPAEGVFITEIKANSNNIIDIYNLQGRRLDRISAPGIYIINGHKRIIR